jgi:hypothetical protein
MESPRALTSRPRDPEAGASAVEFAIVSFLLFVLLFAIIQFGIVFGQDLALSNAARQASRAGAVAGSGTCLDILNEARQGATTVALDTDDLDFRVRVAGSSDLCPGNAALPAVQVFQPCTTADIGEDLQVTVIYDTSFSLPLVGSYAPTLTREGFHRCEFNVAQPVPSPTASP